MFENAIEVMLPVGLFLGVFISWFYGRRRIIEQENRIEKQQNSLKRKDKNLKDLKKRQKEQDASMRDLNEQVSDKEDTIRSLIAQVEERDKSINHLKKELTERKEQIKEFTTLAEIAEEKISELETSLEESQQEVSNLKTRTQIMIDDLAIVEGIGPKVSEVLRSAGINSFKKLATTNVNQILKILEADNPRLIHLVNPTTWPEQAKLAAANDLEALSVLQENLKGGRRI